MASKTWLAPASSRDAVTYILFSDKTSKDIQNDINKKNTELETLKLEIQKVENLIKKKSDIFYLRITIL